MEREGVGRGVAGRSRTEWDDTRRDGPEGDRTIREGQDGVG